ncbi:hypothetical protein AAGM73_26165, partial [Klebsiella pneumoniae]|nr:type IV secretory pathway VirB10 component [Klebsiella pneumoniae]SYF58415.1 type IV secretory pathway VirB10 component [Klebsiella pneumoniae]SYF59670.1 type IV secretory pathway VirB10 component [Klebsiella pneumoniae]
MMSLWDALRMNMMISYQELVRTFPNSRQAFADIAREAFANSVNIPPTLYKNQGEIITLIVGQDLDFSSIYKLKMVGTRR